MYGVLLLVISSNKGLEGLEGANLTTVQSLDQQFVRSAVY